MSLQANPLEYCCSAACTVWKEKAMVNRLQFRTAICATVVWIAASVSAQTTQWKAYSYPSDGFQASYPSEPTVQKKDVDTQAGKFELRTYTAAVGDVALFIGVCDYGEQTTKADPDSMLQGAKNGALINSNSHIVSEQKITMGAYHGLQFDAESDSAHFRARIYMVGSTLYQTLVIYPLSKPYDQTDKFLDSFQLIARSSGSAG
jgi:hypothetical protein